MAIKKIIKKCIPNKLKNKLKQRELNLIKSNIRNTNVKYEVFSSDNGKLENMTAVVTGGSGAIGSAICFRLAMEGAKVFVAGRNKENLEAVVKQITENNGQAEILELDVTNYENIQQVFKSVYEKEGKIDILVNNAGGSARSKNNKIENQDVDVIDDILNVNLRGSILCCKEAIKYMKEKQYGRIVNIGSTTGVNGLNGFSEYAASKSGVIGLTKSLAMEVAEYGITVNCVSPGITNQIIWDKGLEDFPTKTSYIERTGKTDDIANAVEFFCKKESEYVIGQNLIVDGGRSLGLKSN